MRLIIPIALMLFAIHVANVQSNPDVKDGHGELNSEAARQKIYEIISSHEDRKYGDHGGHEYEAGEVPRKIRNRKAKRLSYAHDDGKYYYEQPNQPEANYVPQTEPRQNAYAVSNIEPAYSVHKERYPAVDPTYSEPKRGYLVHDEGYNVRKAPEPVYVLPKAHDDNVYHENIDTYVEDKTAPITIGKTARTVYPSAVTNTHYAVVDPKPPAEYVVIDGKKPRPLILDPKLKATYHHAQPEGHYSSPEHQVVVKPEVLVPVHYPPPVQEYKHYDDHHKSLDKGHHASGHGYYKDNSVKGESGHKARGHHDVAGHKAHSDVAGHHDEHGHHHNRGHYERDRGYHYEKAYAYDRIRAHHDVGSNRGAHSTYGAHHGHEGHKNAGHHGGETYSYFKKNDHGSGYGYQDGNSLYKKGQDYYGQQKYVPVYYHGYNK